MALAETVLRAIHKRGLVPKITKALPKVSVLLTVLSIVWLLMLPMEGNYRNTYISENALMPAQVTSYFRESEWNIVRGFRNELKHYEYSSVDTKNAMVQQWLEESGLKTAYHKLEDPNISDTLYGILHAARGDDTEAMVVVVPWNTSDHKFNLGGAALGVALSRYFNRMSIWSKNIIVVFSQDGHKSLRNWVEAYHTSLDTTAGSIEAAIVLEYEGEADHFEYYEMHYEMLNGQLPNLDFLNTANQVSYQENIHTSIQRTPGEELTRNDYYSRLRTLLKNIAGLTLAGIVNPPSGCECFSGWQIQAFTIKVKGTKGHNDITQIGRVVDSSFRSVNNLLEKFHQSFFFYLMLGPRHFVSIGTYLPSAVIIAVSYAVAALSGILNSNITILDFLLNITNVLIIFVAVELNSYLLSLCLPYLIRISTSEEDKQILVNLILLSMTSVNLVFSLAPLVKNVINLRRFRISEKISYSLISFSLFFISMVITALLILNFSLALAIGILAFPLTFVAGLLKESEVQNAANQFKSKDISSKSKTPIFEIVESNKAKIKLCLCLFVSNPFFIIYIVGNLYLDNFGITKGDGTMNLMYGLLTSWDDFQCWTWFIVMLGWFPAWLCIALTSFLGQFSVIVSPTKKNQ